MQASPLFPQPVAAVPGRQPFVSQQPVRHVAAHDVSMHCCALQTNVDPLLEQLAHEPPPVPHASFVVPSMQAPVASQQPGQFAELQGSRQAPALHVCAPLHVWQETEPVPQPVSASPVSHLSSRQHPWQFRGVHCRTVGPPAGVVGVALVSCWKLAVTQDATSAESAAATIVAIVFVAQVAKVPAQFASVVQALSTATATPSL